MIKPKSKPKKLINLGNCRKTIHEEKRQVKDCSCTGITLQYIGLIKNKQLELKSFNDKTTYLKLVPRLVGRPDWIIPYPSFIIQ